MVNEASLFEALKPHGFELVFLEDLSLSEQVNLFSQAEIIVALHGAGLTNLVFSMPKTRVIEIFPRLDQNCCYATLCQQMDLDYVPYISSYAQWSDWNRGDLQVDVPAIVALLGLEAKGLDKGIAIDGVEADGARR